MILMIETETNAVEEFGLSVQAMDGGGFLLRNTEELYVSYPANGGYTAIDAGEIDIDDFRPSRWLYKDGVFAPNPDFRGYEPPEPPEPPVDGKYTREEKDGFIEGLMEGLGV